MLKISNAPPIFQASRWETWAFLAPVVCLAPLLFLQSLFLWEKEHLQFFPLAFAAAGWFLWQGMPLSPVGNLRRRASFAAVLVGYVAVAAAMLVNSPWFAHLTLVLVIWGWAMGRLGTLTPMRITAICGLMILTVPVPFGGDQGLIRSLQTFSGTASSRLLDVVGVLHLKRGNILEITTGPLFVEEACSGVDSQYALMAVAGVMLLVGRVGLVVSVITILTVPLWAILGNLLRICSIVIGLDWLSVDLATGTAHTVLGLICFAIAAWLHWSSVQLLNFFECQWFLRNRSASDVMNSAVFAKGLSHSRDIIANEPGPPTWGPPDTGPRVHWGWLVLPAATALLFPLGVGSVIEHYRKDVPRINDDVAMLFPKREDLPITLAGQRCVGFNEESRNTRDTLGQHSKVWTYMHATGPKIVSLDLPFRGWHPLWQCYTNAGWRELERKRVVMGPGGESLSFPLYEVELTNNEGDFAVLLFSLFDEKGLPFEEQVDSAPVAARGFAGVLQRITSTFYSTLLETKNNGRDPLTFQFQMLSKTDSPATDDQKQQCLAEYLQLRKRIYDKSMPVIEGLRGL